MWKLLFKSLLTLAGLSVALSSKISRTQVHKTEQGATSAKTVPSPVTFAGYLVPRTMAVILNSGSTNTISYRIFVPLSGQARYIDGDGRGNGKISAALTKKFFDDIKSAMPLEKLPIKQPCIKSVSFGTATAIRLGRGQSPDISCPGNAKTQLLLKDVTAIAQALKVRNVPRSQGHEIPPLNF